jgi:hypothetical protein
MVGVFDCAKALFANAETRKTESKREVRRQVFIFVHPKFV